MRIKIRYITFWVVGTIVSSQSAAAATIFQSTQTGDQLLTNPAVTFHQSVSPSGDSFLDLAPSDSDAKLLTWNLLPAAERGSLSVTVEIDYLALTTDDNDVIVGLTNGDGTAFTGWERADNSNGQWYSRDGIFGSSTPPWGDVESPTLGAVEPFTMDYELGDEVSSTSLLVTEATDSLGFTFSNTLDTDAALSFAWFSSNVGEIYRLNQISITITDENTVVTPIPAALPLFGSAAGILGLAGWRRRKATNS